MRLDSALAPLTPALAKGFHRTNESRRLAPGDDSWRTLDCRTSTTLTATAVTKGRMDFDLEDILDDLVADVTHFGKRGE